MPDHSKRVRMRVFDSMRVFVVPRFLFRKAVLMVPFSILL